VGAAATTAIERSSAWLQGQCAVCLVCGPQSVLPDVLAIHTIEIIHKRMILISIFFLVVLNIAYHSSDDKRPKKYFKDMFILTRTCCSEKLCSITPLCMGVRIIFRLGLEALRKFITKSVPFILFRWKLRRIIRRINNGNTQKNLLITFTPIGWTWKDTGIEMYLHSLDGAPQWQCKRSTCWTISMFSTWGS